MLNAAELRPFYSRFLRDDRILLTGHSHQAWPDIAADGLLRSFADAAEFVDDKWAHAAQAASAVRVAAAACLGGAPEDYALAPNTHELVSRFLSALPWRSRRHLVTTTGEFHSMRRQLGRLVEEGVEVTAVPTEPLDTLSMRLAEAVRANTAALMVSTVLYESSSIVPKLKAAVAAAFDVGAEVLLDAYHHFSIVPWEPIDARAYVVAGGYKYAQWGEGCGFMRVPPDCSLRPVYTGWFSDFASLENPSTEIHYGAGGDRFAGSTYDPASHYRARAVIDFFAQQGMTVEALRAHSLAQTARLIEQLDFLPVRTPRDPKGRAGFVTVQVPGASRVVQALRERGIFTDARGDNLRFGPAPFTTNAEIDVAVKALRELVGGQ